MRCVDCSVCNAKEVPVNDAVKIDGVVYCSSCVGSSFPDESDLVGHDVVRDVDPTVCALCESDFGDVELRVLAGRPICDSCEEEIRKRAFPTWVKVFFAAVLVLVVSSGAWNMRYYLAYSDLKQAFARAGAQDFMNAAALMSSASSRVPESEDLKVLSAYYRGVDYLSNDKSAEALAEFSSCIDKVPEEYGMEVLLNQAQIGACFDRKDYHGMLDACLRQLEYDPTGAVSNATVASAYACLHASEGVDSTKDRAVHYLQRAKQADSLSDEMVKYYDMIAYRIASRRIITREEFAKQFPNGWNRN